MLALFGLMVIPIAGWYFVAELGPKRLVDVLPPGSHAEVLEMQHEIRFKLAITLGLSIIALGAVVLYVRRSVLDPLERLAGRARRSADSGWSTPAEVTLLDEVGDLARALDRSLTGLQRRAEEAERFAADLSHELRTPLAAIRGAAEILTDSELSESDRRRFVGHVFVEAQRLERLVTHLLDLARAERVKQPVEPVQVGAVAIRAAERCEPLLGDRLLTVEVGDMIEVPPVRASAEAVVRVLTILLENAIRHSPRGGTIRLGAGLDGAGVALWVDDEGPGVTPALRERIFDRFFTAEKEPVAAKGTGLGLAIAQALLAGMGGRIGVDDSPRGGARFVVVLPAWDEDSG